MKCTRSYLVLLPVILVVLLGVGYAGFVKEIRFFEHSGDRSDADGVVVLTGGAKRIEAAVSLFEAAHGHRLLISGVGARTTRADLGRRLGKPDLLFGCCVDIDRKALDTRGNAIHTARWAELNDFNKLLVVTSSYHMPRSLLLMKRRMPDVELVGVPIRSEGKREESFWQVAMSPVVISEYAKFLIARFGFFPATQSFRSAFRSHSLGRT